MFVQGVGQTFRDPTGMWTDQDWRFLSNCFCRMAKILNPNLKSYAVETEEAGEEEDTFYVFMFCSMEIIIDF